MTFEDMTQNWRTLNGASIRQSIEAEIEHAIISDLKHGYNLKICIGTDSQVKGNKTEIATAIVFVRKGRGAYMYVTSENIFHQMTIKERMLEEVSRSVTVGYRMLPILDLYDVDMEIHVDINTHPDHKSNAALKEALGYVLGMGFAFKAKPHAFASSCCANKIVQ